MEDPPKSRPGRCRLTLSINGLRYSVRPIVSQDDTVHKAFRLSRRVAQTVVIYDVAETVHGAICDCPDFVFRRDGKDPKGCLHIRAMRVLGLLECFKP